MFTLRNIAILSAILAAIVENGDAVIYAEVDTTDGSQQTFELGENFAYKVEVINPGGHARTELRLPCGLPQMTGEISSIRILEGVASKQRGLKKFLFEKMPTKRFELSSDTTIITQKFVHYPFPESQDERANLLMAIGSKVTAILNKGDNANGEVPQEVEVSFILRLANVNGTMYVILPHPLDNYKFYVTLSLTSVHGIPTYNLADFGKPAEYIHLNKESWGDCNLEVVSTSSLRVFVRPRANNSDFSNGIKGGTIDTLVKYMLDNFKAEKDTNAESDVNVFLFTHVGAISIEVLLKKLLAVFSIKNEQGGSCQLKRNVIEFVLLYLQKLEGPAFNDLYTNTFLEELNKEVAEVSQTENGEDVSSIIAAMSAINSLNEAHLDVKLRVSAPELGQINEEADKGTYDQLITFPVPNLAFQLTNYLWKPFVMIHMHEIVKKLCHGDKSKGKIQNYQTYVNRTNLITNWVAKEISSAKTIEQAAQLIKLFVNVADRCKDKYRDINAMFAIVMGLESTPVNRLTDVWDIVPEPVKSTLETLRRLASLEDNSAAYRALIATYHDPPFTLRLHTLLGELTFRLEGNKPHLYENEYIINFERMRILYRELGVVRLAQSGEMGSGKGYEVCENEETIQVYISNLKCFDEDRVYVMSKTLQARSSGIALKSFSDVDQSNSAKEKHPVSLIREKGMKTKTPSMKDIFKNLRRNSSSTSLRNLDDTKTESGLESSDDTAKNDVPSSTDK